MTPYGRADRVRARRERALTRRTAEANRYKDRDFTRAKDPIRAYERALQDVVRLTLKLGVTR